MRQHLTKYLSITKKEWNGTIVLLIVILLVLALPYAYRHWHKDKLINFKDFDKAVAALEAQDNKALKKSITNNAPLAYTANKLKPGETVDINLADSATFTRVHGIGPSFARRIVAYRKKLGGFVRKEQLREVYGLDAEKYNAIADELSLTNPVVKLIPVNKVSFDELRRFPYLAYKQANAVIQYRAQHGNYRSIDDMRDIAILNDEILRKIVPYISFK